MQRLKRVLIWLAIALTLLVTVAMVVAVAVTVVAVQNGADPLTGLTDAISQIQLLLPASQTSNLNQVVTVERGDLIATLTSTGEVYAPQIGRAHV